MCSLGVSQDFLPTIWHRATSRMLPITRACPALTGPSRCAPPIVIFAFESDWAIPTLQDETPDAASLRLAAMVAGLIEDGDTLQFGVGRLQAAVPRVAQESPSASRVLGVVSAPVVD